MGLELAKQDNFAGVECDFFQDQDSEIYMTIGQLSKALGYASKSAIKKKIERKEYLRKPEFSSSDAVSLVEGNRRVTRDRIVFTEDGIYEVTMLAQDSDRARKFRAWVRNIIKEIRKTGSYDIVEKKIKMEAKTEEEAALMREINRIEKLVEVNDTLMYQTMLNNKKSELKQLRKNKQLESEIDDVKQEVNDIKNILSYDPDKWRKWVNKQFAKICDNSKQFGYKKGESYNILDDKAGANISLRLRNKRDRMKKNGATKTAVNNASKLDVVEEDKRLKEIYTNVVKEMVIKNQ